MMNAPTPADGFNLPLPGDTALRDAIRRGLETLPQRHPGSAAAVFWLGDASDAMAAGITVGVPDVLSDVAKKTALAYSCTDGRDRHDETITEAWRSTRRDAVWPDRSLAERHGFLAVETFGVLSSDGTCLAFLFLFSPDNPASPEAIASAQCVADRVGALADVHARDVALAAARSEGRALLESSIDAMALVDHPQAEVRAANPAFRALFGYGQEETEELPLRAVSLTRWEAESAPGFLPAGTETSRFCEWFRRKDGSIFPAECVQRAFSIDGRPVSALTIRDISDRFEADRRLALADQVFESMGEGALIVDHRLRIVGANRALLAMTGYAKSDAIDRDAGFLYDDAGQWESLARQTLERGISQDSEVLVRKSNGQLFPCKVSLSVASHGNLHAPRLVAIHRDVSQHRRAESHLQFLANHDVLTRLPNRLQLYRRLDQAMMRADREKMVFAILFIDLDRFKNINDTFGHSAGDFLLQMVADRLSKHIRKTDLLARLGGDEFTILAEKIPDPDNVITLANHVMASLARPFHIEGHELFVTASIGISIYPHDGRDTETLIKNADTAMYHAKGLGKNNYQFFLADMHAKPLEHLMMESALRHALERNEFMLYYQPKVDTSTEFIFGMEALLRWNHPTLGIVSPSRFIPLAEETGLIREIGCWALREACRQNAIWQRAGFPSLVVSVNLSTVQLMTSDFVETVERILSETGMDAACLELELTESAIMEAPEQNSRTLRILQNKGVKISIDDFGTGYSSLNYLKRFPINTLKIDQSFVRDIHIDPNDAAITDAVISLAHSLKMTVIAEGVETPEQLRYLQRNGCNAYQGYLFSRPLPSAEFQQLLTVSPQE